MFVHKRFSLSINILFFLVLKMVLKPAHLWNNYNKLKLLSTMNGNSKRWNLLTMIILLENIWGLRFLEYFSWKVSSLFFLIIFFWRMNLSNLNLKILFLHVCELCLYNNIMLGKLSYGERFLSQTSIILMIFFDFFFFYTKPQSSHYSSG